MRIAFLLLVLAVGSAASHAQNTLFADAPIAAEKLQQDTAILRFAMEQLHPGLYRYSSKAKMDRAFDELARDFQRDRTLEEVYLRLARFAAEIRCGHTYLNPLNQSKPVTAALFNNSSKLPFFYRWLDKHMVVTRDFTPDHVLPAGTEILSVNGVKSPELLTRLMQFASADGGNDAKRIALSEEVGNAVYENPDVFLPKSYPDSRVLHLRIRRFQQRRSFALTVTKLTTERRAAVLTMIHPASNGTDALFTLEFLPGGSALLTMPTWVMYNSPWDWKTWLNSSLDKIVARKSPALIIDIRGNTGGDDVGSFLLSRLGANATPPNAFIRLVRYRKVPGELLPNLSTWDDGFKNWGSRAAELVEPWPTAPLVHYFQQIEQPAPVTDKQLAGERFAGRLYVLTDASNSSATFSFARTVQQQRLGRLVGGPTGGNMRGINGGAFFFLTLPNSQLEIDLPLIGYFPATVEPDGGLLPDELIPMTIGSIATGKDPILGDLKRWLR